jgi:hypothetical protein
MTLERLRRDARAGSSRGNRRDPAILTKPCERLGTPDFSPACSCFKTVSRRREKKGRLRRDALTGLSRGNQRADFESP